MGQVHNALRRGPLGKAIKGALGDVTTDGMLERWGETLTPVMDAWSMPEWAFLRQDAICGGVTDVSGAAGTIPETMLFNPPGSKCLGVVMRIRWSWITTTGQNVHLRLFRGAALPGGFVVNNAGPLDTRDPKLVAAPSTKLIVAQASNAAVSGGIPFDSVLVNAVGIPNEENDPIILAPGTGVCIGPANVGVQRMLVGIRWRERFAFQGELGF